jgi:hypothetical protein
VPEGRDLVPCGTPVATFVDTEEELAAYRPFKSPTTNVYDEEQPQVWGGC